MLTLTQHVSCCYSESEMKAEGEGQCAEGRGNCEGQCQQCLVATHATTLFYVPCVVVSSRSRKSCNEGLLRTIANEQDFFSARGTRGQTSLITCGRCQSAYSTGEETRTYLSG